MDPTHGLFDKIYYINLDRRTDRNAHMTQLLKNYNLDGITERITAVDGSKLDMDKIPHDIITQDGIEDAKNKKQRVFVPMTPGAIGCAMSHRNIWQIIAKSDLKSALILEDDVYFDPAISAKLEAYKVDWPKSYDVIFLGYSSATIKNIYEMYNDLFYRTKREYGLFGYIVSKKGAEKLLKIFPIKNQLDTEMHKNFSSLDAYVIKPENRIIFSDLSEKSVQFGTDIQKREHFDTLYQDPMTSFFDNFVLISFLLLIVALIAILIDTLVVQKER